MDDRESTADRRAQTVEVFELGVEMMAANPRRRHPSASSGGIAAMLETWLAERPGAETGDAAGVPVPLSRFR